MEAQYVYLKKRSDFGRQCLFSDKGPDLIDNYPPNKILHRDYILRDPVNNFTQCSKVFAEHEVCTEKAKYTCTSMNHAEGGWPKDVNINDEEHTKRYRRKIEKDDSYVTTVTHLIKGMEHCIYQNNAVNIYQQYFSDVEPAPLVEQCSSRTVSVFQDQCPVPRPVTHISWAPEGGTKIAVTHCNLDFQPNKINPCTHSYIWELDNPNSPELILKPKTPLICLEYNMKDSNFLVSGMTNGLVAVFDTRRGSEPVELSVAEVSHRDPVLNVLWIHSKTGTEFFSSSPDGQCKWWDTRKLSEPTETLILDLVKGNEEQSMARAAGASCLEYELTIPTRFMVGTEHGTVISGNRKGKSASEKLAYQLKAHLGPVYALQRSPAFVKNFLTVGDWTAKIWSEDCKESSIMWTSFHKSLLTCGTWSPTRYSVYFVTRADGTIEAWDVLQQQKRPTLMVKVCDDPLTTIRAHEHGRCVALGSQKGTTFIVEFSENLATANKNDKALLTAMFERESHRERILEARLRELKLKQKTKSAMRIVEPLAPPPPSETEEEVGADVEEEGEEEEEEELDPEVLAADIEYYEIVKEELKQYQPPEEEEEEEQKEEELPPPPPPPPEPTPPPPPPKEDKKGKKEKGKKKK